MAATGDHVAAVHMHREALEAQQDVLAALKIVDDHLLKNSFLVGSNITLADITLVCSLDLAYRMVFDPKYRANFPNVTRWFATCVNQPEFVAIMGPVELCAKMQEAKAHLCEMHGY